MTGLSQLSLLHPGGSQMKWSMVLLLAVAGCGASPDAEPAAPRSHLYVWTASTDTTAPDFLAILDVTEDSAGFGRLVGTVPAPTGYTIPHHTEHEMPADGRLFASGFRTGATFIFDLNDPEHSSVTTAIEEVDGFSHPHSYLRLPNGNVLATFQMRHDASGMGPGGLVEMTPQGEVVRSASAAGPGVPAGLRPYSAAIVPSLDRIVTSSTDMDHSNPYQADQVQIWRLSTLELLHTITLPPGPLGDEGQYTAEPRLLADGRSVMVSTFNCGLYLLEDIDGAQPSGKLVATFPWSDGKYCAIPVVVGDYYLVTVPEWNAVVSLDVSNPAAPREVGRLTLGPEDVPHWIAIAPDQRRLVVTGYGAMMNRVVIASLDPATGALAIDERFRTPGDSLSGISMAGVNWPHGGSAPGVPHGAVFGPATPRVGQGAR